MRKLLTLLFFGLVAMVGASWLSAPANAQTSYFQTDHSACAGHCTLHVSTTGPAVIERDINSMTCSLTAPSGTVTGVVATVSIQTPPAADNPPPGTYLVYNLTGVAGATVNGKTTIEMLPNGTALPMVVPASSSVIVSFTLNGTGTPTGTVVCALRGTDVP